MTLLLVGVGAFLVLVTLLGFLPVAHGLSRMAEVPRQQLAIAALIHVIVAASVLQGSLRIGVVGLTTLVGCVQLAWILRFTPVWPKQAVTVHDVDPQRSIRVLVLNVKQSNRAYERTLRLIADYDADVIILVEVDQAWMKGVAASLGEWPHRLVEPRDTGYGLAMFSRLMLTDTEVRHLVLPGVPSLWAVVELRDARRVRLVAAHPEPPVPHHDSVGRDAELGRVATEVADDPLPCIVTGDLNDVGWSRTTRRFQRLSGLVDPRVGRGFFNSYHTATRLLRWPLDHLFHDSRFGLVSMERLVDVGSDHFPIGFHLQWMDHNEAREPEEARADDHAAVEKLVELEADRQRAPVGEGWEQVEPGPAHEDASDRGEGG